MEGVDRERDRRDRRPQHRRAQRKGTARRCGRRQRPPSKLEVFGCEKGSK